ncbi:cytosolic carboxypeptidase 2-like isoform X2 [Xyrauchen texanus]|uniref:cytosolic carboxypeptidase 2-like isoform X2 n=1 Tax=Xyrauchen texanus TaxID=154827 RepID=UPI0022425DB1|nr:cytosolic carboxypeptidase 2-like isoform X2 [Xyrauchen texanus]
MQKSVDPCERFISLHLQHYGFFSDNGSSSVHAGAPIKREWEGNDDSTTSDIINSPTEGNDYNFEETKPYLFNLDKVLRTRQLLFDFNGERPIPRLRDPLDLFTIPSTSCPFQGVRWPIECEVIRDKIQHIKWDPPEPEPFYQPTGDGQAPIPVGDERRNTVYCIDSATKTSYFTYSRVGGSRGPIKCATSCANHQNEPKLAFESRFESGNLQKAVQVGQYDYELTLRTDLYTTKHTQWFYFRVRNMRAGITYRFTIINLMKASSLYSAGMRPLLYSEHDAWAKGEGWKRAGNNIRYYRNNTEQDGKALYSLTWTLEFPYDSDTCYLAHCYPYTYSDLQRYLRDVISDPVRASHCKLRVLCRSLGGNAVYVLTITSPSTSLVERKAKQAVVLTARVHPGETNGSWMMQGFLEFILSDLPDACLLREIFVFKVIPMLNPDGVVVGNYRCSLAGRDLNRNYRTLLRDSFPCIWYTRNMVKRLLSEKEVVVYCDFHGHSRKNNVFMYGCNDHKDASQCLQERIFPLMMSKNAKDKFSFRSCKFKIHKSKEGTGRIVMWRLGIRNSYTMESTFGGSTLGDRKGTHFSTQDLKSMGYCFCDTLLDFCDPDSAKTTNCLEELGVSLRQEVSRKLGREVDSLDDLSVIDIESSTSGSNSTESDGLPVHLLNGTNQQIQGKKKHLKSRKERNQLRQERIRSARPKIVQRNVRNLDPVASNEDMVKVRIQEKTMCIMKDTKKQKVPCVARVNQTVRSWIPHPTSHIGVVDHVTLWENQPDKVTPTTNMQNNSYSSCRHSVSGKCDEPGCRTYQQTTSSAPHGQLQRQTLLVTGEISKRCPSVPSSRERTLPIPIQPYTIPFYPDFSPQPGMKGTLPVSNTSYRSQQKCRQEKRTQESHVPVKFFMPLDDMGTLRISHKKDEQGAVAGLASSPNTELCREANQSNEQDARNGSLFLPDLYSHTRLFGNKAATGGLRLGRLPKANKIQQIIGRDAASTKSLSSEEMFHPRVPQEPIQADESTNVLPHRFHTQLSQEKSVKSDKHNLAQRT